MAAPLIIQTGWPGRVLSPNGRPNRWRKAEAVKAAKNEAYFATSEAIGRSFATALPDRVKVTIHARPAVVRNRDDDNLVASCKAFLDGIAARLGVDDRRFDLQPVHWIPARSPGQLRFEVEVANA
jgi:crossover junction endodeoxyribonuclease RusA